jgi:hypothetical protein
MENQNEESRPNQNEVKKQISTLKYGIIAVKPNKEFPEKSLDILHFCGYWEKPSETSYQDLYEDLRCEEGFDLGDKFELIEAPKSVVKVYKNIALRMEQKDKDRIKYTQQHWERACKCASSFHNEAELKSENYRKECFLMQKILYNQFDIITETKEVFSMWSDWSDLNDFEFKEMCTTDDETSTDEIIKAARYFMDYYNKKADKNEKRKL